MKNATHIVLKAIFSLPLLMGVLGALSVMGLIPGPTRELYNTDIAFEFIDVIYRAAYIEWLMAIVSVLSLVALWTRREALAALLILPITVNVISFHAFIDGGIFTVGSIPSNIMFALNIYFLWKNRQVYQTLLEQR